jgi:polyphenol oxidase
MPSPPPVRSRPAHGSVTEEAAALGGLPVLIRRDWSERFPWLVQGVTTRVGGGGSGREAPFDLRLHGPAPAGEVLARWERLRTTAELNTVVHSRQLHGSVVRVHGPMAPGFVLAPPCDGHATREAGILLAISLADCVPVFLVEPARRVVALLHAGWRGVAAGILEEGLRSLSERFAVLPEEVHLHLGPAIGGASYQVGPEVHEALGLPVPEGPAPMDLRGVLAERAVAAGVPEDAIALSSLDTRTDARLFSHREGDEGRHVGFLGIRERPGGGR